MVYMYMYIGCVNSVVFIVSHRSKQLLLLHH